MLALASVYGCIEEKNQEITNQPALQLRYFENVQEFVQHTAKLQKNLSNNESERLSHVDLVFMNQNRLRIMTLP
jgi:CHASE3 domain sensor protein